MDKICRNSNGPDVLTIKTGINLYRCFTFVLFVLSAIVSIFAMANNRDKFESVFSLFMSLIFLLITVFMDKLVYVLKIPTNYLIVSKNEIIYKKRKKQFIYKTSEISCKFHSFFEDFESLSQLHIISSNDELYVSITKKQYELIKQVLEVEKT